MFVGRVSSGSEPVALDSSSLFPRNLYEADQQESSHCHRGQQTVGQSSDSRRLCQPIDHIPIPRMFYARSIE